MGYLNKGLPPPRVQPNAAGPAEGDSSPVPGSGSFKGGGSFRSTGGSFRKSRLAISFASNGAETSERTTPRAAKALSRRGGSQAVYQEAGRRGGRRAAGSGSAAAPSPARLAATAREARWHLTAQLRGLARRCSIASAADDEGPLRGESRSLQSRRPPRRRQQMTRRFSTLGGMKFEAAGSISGSFLNNIAEFETKLAVFGGILGARKGTVAGDSASW